MDRRMIRIIMDLKQNTHGCMRRSYENGPIGRRLLGYADWGTEATRILLPNINR